MEITRNGRDRNQVLRNAGTNYLQMAERDEIIV
jgi:hypothetical protein